MPEAQVALYARVSSDQQARGNTIASQVAGVRERIAADTPALDAGQVFIDDGYSGTTLRRPALERLRDAVAAGVIDRVYVHAPDRLARRYAYQVLLIEEFRRAGAEVIFVNRPIGTSAEDDLLLQVQGMIAEYERAKILEEAGADVGTPRAPASRVLWGGRPSATATSPGMRVAGWRGSR